jgi:FKBP-type peptidyl-prolyl cis-trans isomerase
MSVRMLHGSLLLARRDGADYPHEGQIVRMHYVGRLPNGTVFESSRDRGRAFQFRLGAGQVIRGFEYAVPQLTRGTRARFRIPSELAYGAAGRLPKIPPHTPLEFEVQIIDFYDPDSECRWVARWLVSSSTRVACCSRSHPPGRI